VIKNPPLRALHEHDEGDHANRHRHYANDQPRRDCALAAEFQSIDNGRRKAADDAREK